MNERDLVVVRRLFNARRLQLAMLAVRYGIVASNASRDYPEAGGLMSYGTDVTDAFRQAGIYAGRVLKGAKPALGWMAPLRHLGAKVLVGREPPAKSEPSINEITTIGLDLAKHVFQVHRVDAEGTTVLRNQLRRAQLLVF